MFSKARMEKVVLRRAIKRLVAPPPTRRATPIFRLQVADQWSMSAVPNDAGAGWLPRPDRLAEHLDRGRSVASAHPFLGAYIGNVRTHKLSV